jgi:hypothetical protein
MARWAAGLQFDDLSPEAVYQAKRFLLDSLGCALGGFSQHDVKIVLPVLEEIAGSGVATIIGTGKKVDPVSAALVRPGQRAHGPGDGLQRHLLAAGSQPSVRFDSGCLGLLRARR